MIVTGDDNIFRFPIPEICDLANTTEPLIQSLNENDPNLCQCKRIESESNPEARILRGSKADKDDLRFLALFYSRAPNKTKDQVEKFEDLTIDDFLYRPHCTASIINEGFDCRIIQK